MRLVCARCARPLTRECREGAPAEWVETYEPEANATPAGVMARIDREIANDVTDGAERVVGRQVWSEAGAWSVNPADLLREHLRSSGLDAGCCGSDGCDGPNRSCLCGLVVGTEWSDCWTQHEMRLKARAVRAE